MGFFFSKLPYKEKHVLQQASILGNMENFGVLRGSAQALLEGQCDHTLLHRYENDTSAVVEFGAGRGYLTQILADCYGIKKVYLVERNSYKLKVSVDHERISLSRLSRFFLQMSYEFMKFMYMLEILDKFRCDINIGESISSG